MTKTDVPSEWQLSNNALRAAYRFDSSASALEFIATAGLTAEKLNHHPEVTWRYETVQLAIVFAGQQGESELDLKLAAGIAKSAKALGAIPVDTET